jgi:hypothetical protein
MLLLVPAAGYGLRAGAPPAKELLNRPNTEKKFIDLPLEIAKKYAWPILVISRKNKTELNQYLVSKQTRDQMGELLQTHLIESSQDWFDSLLQSEPFWLEHNIVFLPDVHFTPENILLKMQKALFNAPIVAAAHQVPDPNNWGHIYSSLNDGIDSDRQTVFFEKPSIFLPPIDRAWGLMGFHKNWGAKILNAQAKSQKQQVEQTLNLNCQFLKLESFEDLTR